MIRCRECDHSNPDDHRFCSMCGAKLEPAVRPLDIDENDPLELETPVYQFKDRSRLRQPAEVVRGDRQREQIRDSSSVSSNGGRRVRQMADVGQLPREIIEPTVETEYAENSCGTSTGIGGPSFLGLNYESESNRGFVYDKPRQDGFVYDTNADTPEYLLEEVPRGVSWRALALFVLLIVGGGLGYIQWRASHHQGPDLASILARNGPTVDPSGPVLPDKSAKPADKTNLAASTNSDVNAKDNSQSEDKNASGSADSGSDEESPVIDSNASAAKPEDSKTGNSKAAKADRADSDNNDSDNPKESGKAAAATSAAKKMDATEKSADEDENSAKPESDGPGAKAAKAARKSEVVDEEPAQPKTLGDKDPLLIEANKYIQGRGVRKNCSTGINLLRQAVSEGNPAASVKLGALYWSGTCVTQSKVTAFQWFSRAHSLEPKNRWVERSRNSLWASMSPEEQRRTSY